MVTIKIGMLHYVLDHVYGAFMHRTKLSPQFFSRGWGGTKLDLFEKMINQIFPEVEGPKMIKPMWRTVWETKSACLKEGVFRTPCDEQIINALPPESHIARVAFLAPKYVPPHKMACVVHLAGSCINKQRELDSERDRHGEDGFLTRDDMRVYSRVNDVRAVALLKGSLAGLCSGHDHEVWQELKIFSWFDPWNATDYLSRGIPRYILVLITFRYLSSFSPQSMACTVSTPSDARYLWITLLPALNVASDATVVMGTGDHSFERRLRLGGPLLKENIATMVLESPFYGQRRPFLQSGSKLLCVSDLLLLGRATIEEARSLLHWLDCEEGYGKMGVCGLSMGGVHAAMVGSLHPTPVATFPFLSPHSAVVAFCEGVLKHATAWDALREDLSAAMTLDQVQERMRHVLSLTDVTRFPVPKAPNAVILVAATDDGYIPSHSVLEVQRAWPGSEVRWVNGGHVSSFILHNGEFRRAIRDGLNRLQWKESPL
ncbi:protein ABHD18 [Tanacetum coccineum]|uniref:Protein ABHD18 n=1 Tax=Tanacetum coccineum TaxID=301880 RepID=A0ABQ4X121_9ASTR